MSIDEMVEWISDASLEHAQLYGGYSAKVGFVDGVIAVAYVEDDEPHLVVISDEMCRVVIESAKRKAGEWGQFLQAASLADSLH